MAKIRAEPSGSPIRNPEQLFLRARRRLRPMAMPSATSLMVWDTGLAFSGKRVRARDPDFGWSCISQWAIRDAKGSASTASNLRGETAEGAGRELVARQGVSPPGGRGGNREGRPR